MPFTMFSHVNVRDRQYCGKLIELCVPGGCAVCRWDFKNCALHAVHEGRRSLCITFNKIMTEPGWDKETIAQSMALKEKLEDFDFTFLFRIFQSIFGLTEPSRFCKVRRCTLKNAKIGSRSLSVLSKPQEQMRCSVAYDETVQAVGEPVPRCKCNCHGWEDLEQGVNQHQQGDEKTVLFYRCLYFQIVDSIVLHMTQRFAYMEHLSFFQVLDHT